MSANSSLIEFFTEDHRACDERWAEVEAAVDAGGAEGITAAWQTFDRVQRHHLQMEEQLLFPAFEKATGMTQGPTMMMRMEHDQMRGLLDQMAEAMERGDHQEVLDVGDTLLMLIQQHNQKEEGMLYPMAERALAPSWSALKERIDAL